MKRIDISGLQKNRSIYLKVGFIFSFSFILMAFNYTVEKPKISSPIIEDLVDIEDIEIKRTKQSTPKPPPVLELKEKFETVEEVEIEIPEEPKKYSIEIEDPEPDFELGDDDGDDPDPEIEEPEVDEPLDILIEEPVLDFAEYMPSFGNCNAHEMDKETYKQCSDAAMLQYFAKHIKYPTIARENNIQGKVILQFVIDENGKIQSPKIAKGVAGGCSEEALRVLRSMPQWKPGRHQGRYVKVNFTLPVSFQLK